MTSHSKKWGVVVSLKKEIEGNSVRLDIVQICDDIKNMLLEKNKKYGNSALDPKRIFSKASAEEQILVRIDDKLSRVSNQNTNEDEDVINDLIGYLILLKIARENKKQNN